MWGANLLEKTWFWERLKAKAKGGGKRERWLDIIITSTHEFEQNPGDSEGQKACSATVHRVTKSQTRMRKLNNDNNNCRSEVQEQRTWGLEMRRLSGCDEDLGQDCASSWDLGPPSKRLEVVGRIHPLPSVELIAAPIFFQASGDTLLTSNLR